MMHQAALLLQSPGMPLPPLMLDGARQARRMRALGRAAELRREWAWDIGHARYMLRTDGRWIETARIGWTSCIRQYVGWLVEEHGAAMAELVP